MRANYKNPAIHKAFNVLEALSADKKTRLLAEMREKALRNERSELAAAKKEGIVETARTLLRMGALNIGQIAEATGLSVKEIRKLQKTGK